MEELKVWITTNLNDITFVIITIVAAVLLSRTTKYLINRFLKRSGTFLKADPTNFKFLKNSISVIIFLLALVLIMYRIPGGKTLAVSLFASAGIFAAILGFASQQAFSNIIGGIFIVIFKPFRVDDLIQIGTDHTGVVEDITLRHTVIRNFENRRIIIPNSAISADTVINSSIGDPRICRHVHMNISFDSDINLAKKIMQEEGTNHPLLIDYRDEEQLANGDPLVAVRVISFGESSILLRAYVWAKDPSDSFILLTDLNQSIKERFDKEGIELPYPHRTIVYKKDPDSPPHL